MGIIVHPAMKKLKLPHPQVGSNSGIDNLNPNARQHWNAPTLNTMAYCVHDHIFLVTSLMDRVTGAGRATWGSDQFWQQF